MVRFAFSAAISIRRTDESFGLCRISAARVSQGFLSFSGNESPNSPESGILAQPRGSLPHNHIDASDSDQRSHDGSQRDGASAEDS